MFKVTAHSLRMLLDGSQLVRSGEHGPEWELPGFALGTSL
jgi:hypothetical protein